MTPANHREQLVNMLSEAAEVEHCLMCTYLYGAFSLKQSRDEGLSESEFSAVQRWRREVISIATDEMLHLSLVSNLMIALGARPHYRRFNFPIAAGLFPADVAIELAPFDEATLDHFVYLERPRDVAERDAGRYEKSVYRRGVIANRLMSFAVDYETVGELYETIDLSLVELSQRMGEAALFIGPRDNQLSTKDFRLPGLCTIGSLADARKAIHLIVNQGEGSPVDKAGSHYARFCAIRSEWKSLAQKRPDFSPYRTAARNPIMRPSVVQGARVHVIAEPASTFLDAGNACYALMLRLLALMSDDASFHRVPRREIAEQSLMLMHVLAEVGSHLSTLPANDAYPGITAGITFTASRAVLAFQSPDCAAAVLGERYGELARRFDELAEHLPGMRRYGATLKRYGEQWLRVGPTSAASAAAVVPAPDVPIGQALHATSDAAEPPKVDVAEGRDVVVRFDHGRCIHARHCVLGEPDVFVANKPGEWIYPDQATSERLAIVAHNCPSGAITYTRKDGGVEETAPQVNLARLRENGPLAFHAELHIAGSAPCFRATLCRCGQSMRKPFCDGSHSVAGFAASGEPAARASEPLASRNGILDVTPLRNGPLEVSGNLELCAGTGRTLDRVTSVRLCRCGHSQDKPYCDNSHLLAGFSADGA